MDLPDYQKLACELAEAAWKLEAEAALGGDEARAAMANEIARRAIAMCSDLGLAPPCPPNHLWCASGCGKRAMAGRCASVVPEPGRSVISPALHG
ncbi:hypothetical protein [Azospirillum sp. sgz301742]